MEKGYVKSLRVLLVPVDWLLMDGCIFCVKRASVMDNLLWLNSVNNIFCVVYKVCSGEWQVMVG